jgi:hypothetical protein
MAQVPAGLRQAHRGALRGPLIARSGMPIPVTRACATFVMTRHREWRTVPSRPETGVPIGTAARPPAQAWGWRCLARTHLPAAETGSASWTRRADSMLDAYDDSSYSVRRIVVPWLFTS